MIKRLAILLVLVSAACGGGGGASSVPLQPAPQVGTANFVITIPQAITTSSRGRMYISSGTKAVTVSVNQNGHQVASVNLVCGSGQCTGSVQAPLGSDTFVVMLYDQSQHVLSSGQATQTINAGSNVVSLTFNPVVVAVNVTLDPSENAPYLTRLGPSSAKLDVTFLDASGAQIIGPGMFLAANNTSCVPTALLPCLTVTLSSSDTSGATALSPTSFSSAASAITSNLTVTGTIPAFDDVTITPSANGVSTLTSVSVPLSPVVTAAFSTNPGSSGPPSGSPTISSIAGSLALQLDQYVAGANSYQPNPIVRDMTRSDGTAVCCSVSAISLAGTRGGNAYAALADHLVTGIPSPISVVGTASDTVAWFVDESFGSTVGGFTIADLTTNKAYNDVVALTASARVTTMIADPTYHLWFSSNEGGGFIPKIGAFDARNPPGTPWYLQLPADQTSGRVDALIPGPSNIVYAIVSTSTDTYIDPLTYGNVQSGTTSGDIKVSPSTNLLALNNGLEPAAGYTSSDGMLYLGGNDGKFYRVNPATGAATSVPLTGTSAALTQTNSDRPAMTALPDGTLAFVGSTTNLRGAFDVVHIFPGTQPYVHTVLPNSTSCGFSPCNEGTYWSIATTGGASNYSAVITASDGAHSVISGW